MGGDTSSLVPEEKHLAGVTVAGSWVTPGSLRCRHSFAASARLCGCVVVPRSLKQNYNHQGGYTTVWAVSNETTNSDIKKKSNSHSERVKTYKY